MWLECKCQVNTCSRDMAISVYVAVNPFLPASLLICLDLDCSERNLRLAVATMSTRRWRNRRSDEHVDDVNSKRDRMLVWGNFHSFDAILRNDKVLVVFFRFGDLSML